MLKKVIKYIGFDGNQEETTEYFNLTRLELLHLQKRFSNENSKNLESYISEIVEQNDIDSMLELLEAIVLESYGQKSEDGKRFIKSKDLYIGFSQSLAYDALFEEFLVDTSSLESFVNGIISGISKTESTPELNSI